MRNLALSLRSSQFDQLSVDSLSPFPRGNRDVLTVPTRHNIEYGKRGRDRLDTSQDSVVVLSFFFLKEGDLLRNASTVWTYCPYLSHGHRRSASGNHQNCAKNAQDTSPH
jgi:hypothetical protein